MSAPASDSAAASPPETAPRYRPNVVFDDDTIDLSSTAVDLEEAYATYTAGCMVQKLLAEWKEDLVYVHLATSTYYSESVSDIERWPRALLDFALSADLHATTVAAGKHGDEHVTYDDVNVALLTDEEAAAVQTLDRRMKLFCIDEPRFFGDLGDTIGETLTGDGGTNGMNQILFNLAVLDANWPSGTALATLEGVPTLMPAAVADERALAKVTGPPLYLALLRRFLGSARREGNTVTYSLMPPIYDPRPPPPPSSAPSPAKRAKQ
jgi:hypothetical protein